MSTEDTRMEISKDKDTQEMIHEARENYPNLELSDAIQEQANQGPGREATPHEGASMIDRIKDSVSESVQNVKETLKEMNPGTRDMTEKHD